jgi:hypothetical protein
MDMIPTRHEVTGHECDFPEDTIPAWRARGWIPLSEIDEAADTAADELGAEPAAETTPTPTRASRVPQPAIPKEPTP